MSLPTIKSDLKSAKIEVREMLELVTNAAFGRIASGTEDYRPGVWSGNKRGRPQRICSPKLVAYLKKREKKICSNSRSANCITGENSDETRELCMLASVNLLADLVVLIIFVYQELNCSYMSISILHGSIMNWKSKLLRILRR